VGNLNKQQQQMIAFAIILVVGLYFYWGKMLKPTLADIKQSRIKYEDLYAKAENARLQAVRLPALQSELEKLRTELRDLEKQLPTDKDLPSIIRIITREAQQENIDFARMTPKDHARQNFFEVIPFDLQLTGSLHSLARFLASLGQQDRIFQAQNIRLQPLGQVNELAGMIILNITLSIQTYAYSG